jgi:1-acyl-sn-glycerol-3-phosphate acyltransferase
MLALGLRVEWLGKDALFRPPFGPLLRRLGGIPVDRSVADGVVDAAVERLRRESALWLGLSPEGTRKKVERWKTGFHRIARRSGVPILLVGLDYRRRVVGIGPLVTPTEDLEADLAAIRSRFVSAMARNPDSY